MKHYKMGKIDYPKDLKQTVLKFYEDFGPKKAAEKFGLKKHLILEWRKAAGFPKFTNRSNGGLSQKSWTYYQPHFKLEVVEYAEENGAEAAASKFGINSNLVYRWRKHKQEILNKNPKDTSKLAQEQFPASRRLVENSNKLSATHCSRSEEKEIIDYFVKYGEKLTLVKYGIASKRLYNWRVRYNDEYQGTLIRKIKKEKRKKSEGSRSRKNKVYDYDEETKSKVVEAYLKDGAVVTEGKYNIPRQTIRNWALKQGRVASLVTEEKEEALRVAKQYGVKKATAKFAVSRASLYNWAKCSGGKMEEDSVADSLSVTVPSVNKCGSRKLVFYRKKEKPVKIRILKKKKEKKQITKLKSTEVVEKPSVELPEWALNFIKQRVPKVVVSNTSAGVLVDIPAGEDQASSNIEDPMKIEKDEGDSMSEYECDYDYVELDLFTTLPYYSPSNNVTCI